MAGLLYKAGKTMKTRRFEKLVLAASALVLSSAGHATVIVNPPLLNWTAPQPLEREPGITASPRLSAPLTAKTPEKAILTLSSFIPLSPCRLVDTRGVFSPVYAGGPFAANEARVYSAAGNCGIPTGSNRVQGVSVAITTPPTAASGDIEVIKNGAPLGNTVAMVLQAGQWNSVSATPGVDAAGNFQVQLRSTPGDVVIDVNGYYGTTDTANNDLLVINGKNDSPGGVLVVNTTTTQPFSGAINAQNLASGTGVLLAEGGNAAIDVTGG